MTDVLDQFIFGTPIIDDQPADSPAVLALSNGLLLEDAQSWRDCVSLSPFAYPSVVESQTIGIFAGPDHDYILARAHHQQDTIDLPVFQYVMLPGAVYRQMAGDFSLLMELMNVPIVVPAEDNTTIAPLEVPATEVWTVAKRAALIESLIDAYGDMETLLVLLGAALDKRHLLACGFDGDTSKRLALVQGLMMLLPAPARADLTFSTYTTQPGETGTKIVFSDQAPVNGRWTADFEAGTFPESIVLDSPYLSMLRSLWDGDVEAFLTALEPLELIAPYVLGADEDEDIANSLNKVAKRHDLDRCALAGESISVEKLKTVLTGDVPMSNDLQICYSRLMLYHALMERDAEAADIVMSYMDANPVVDEALNITLNEALQDQPDSVYVFIRTRLRESETVDSRWLPRLKAAALCSLDVALKDGDTATLSGWLKLISREPADYDLGELLHQGILAAVERAHDDGELGSQLILLAARRSVDLTNTLLEDETLVTALPEIFRLAFQDYDPESILALREQGRRIFLIALQRARAANVREVFTAPIIEALWEIFNEEKLAGLPDEYQAESFIREWIENGVDWLSSETLEVLLTLMVARERDELFYQLAQHLGEHEILFPMLATVFQNSGRSVTAILGLIGQLVTAGNITQQQAVNTYLALLAAWDWQLEALPLVEQMVRMIQQSASLTLTSEVGWRLLEVGSAANSELIARVAVKRLTAHLETIEDKAELVDHLLRLHDQVQWSQNVRQLVLDWWREFTRLQPLVNLQQIDKKLEGIRALEDARNIVETAVALRKLLGNRSLQEFAADINTTYNVLEAFCDSFDPAAKQSLNFDQPTVRAVLGAKGHELNPQERKLLAKNLKEMAQLITLMADNRSKTPLMRREDEFERQLTTGEQTPHSAIDTMKWMFGYLDGIQDTDEDEKE